MLSIARKSRSPDTVLDVVGAKVDGGYLPGTSLLRDVPEARVVRHACWRTHRCLAERRGTEKFIDHYRDRSPQLFDLAADQLKMAAEEIFVMDENKMGIYYELGDLYEKLGNKPEALKYYKEIYARDIGFRDVSTKLQTLHQRPS